MAAPPSRTQARSARVLRSNTDTSRIELPQEVLSRRTWGDRCHAQSRTSHLVPVHILLEERFTATCLRITSHKFHKSPPTTYGHLIRSLYARLIASWDLSITSFTDRPHFGLLFHDQTSTGTNSSLTWQDDFPNLEELELKIVVYLDTELRWADACSSCGITPAQFDGLRKRRSW